MEAVENIAKYQNQTRKWRDNKVIMKIIQDGDLVLRRRPNAEKVGKLHPKWEGPYLAKVIERLGSLHLTNGEGRTRTRT